MKRSLLKNEIGESIIAILLAVIALAGIFMAIMPPMIAAVNGSEKTSKPAQVCRNVSQNVLSVLRSNGVQAKAFRTPIGKTSVFLNDSRWHSGRYSFNKNGVETEVGASKELGGSRWPRLKAVNWSPRAGGANYLVNTPLLIQSTINGLLSIYNEPGNRSCTQTKGILLDKINNLSTYIKPNFPMHNITTSIRIRPYDLNTGDVLACKSPLKIRPYAKSEPPKAVSMGIIDFGDYRADRGLEAEVFVNVELKSKFKGQQDNAIEEIDCSSIGRFQFARHDMVPDTPKIKFNGDKVTISAPPGDFDPGTHLVCRSTYYYLLNRNNEATRATSGFGASVPSTVNARNWVPCDRVKACGSNAMNTSVDQNAGSIANTYNFPKDCFWKIEARVFDVAGNLSGIRSNTYFDGSGTPTTYTPVVNPGTGNENEAVNGYEVGGVQFETHTAAVKAASISNMPITEIENPTNAQDAAMQSTASALQGATDSRDAASSAMQSAQSAQSVAQGALNSASGATTSASSATASAATATAAASQATSAAASASAAASQAAASYEATKQAAASGGLGAIGQAAVQEAKAAKEKAEEEAELAEAAAEAARRAAEAARQAAEAKREAEDDDDDNNQSA